MTTAQVTPAQALLVVGDLVTDVVALHAKPLSPDTDTSARIAVRPGGSAANTAAWAAHAGVPARLLSRVGADSADWHREALARGGVETCLRVDRDRPTAVVIDLVDGAGERTFVTDRGASGALGPSDWQDALLDGVGRMHLSGYLLFGAEGRALAAVAVAAARARGIGVSVDPASSGFLREFGADRFLALLGGVDLLLPNLDEARALTGQSDPSIAARVLSARCHCLVALKLGSAGALLAEHGALLGRVPAPAAVPLDSTGAGDAFAGGLLAALLDGADPAAAAAAGCRLGATAVLAVGGRPAAATAH
ncbi:MULTISPECIES: carbohydrate kinase family protein [Streptacidiphilus]|uniref:Carbohydrate kinase family protein n=1 Tax=Streptacidiphilus cavernicola TaxID=3342716 RepID=A0ABV6UTI6_9ACTN|nr:PfkB family carbohydrate kinase [Streptacidiphilus jeojiense]